MNNSGIPIRVATQELPWETGPPNSPTLKLGSRFHLRRRLMPTYRVHAPSPCTAKKLGRRGELVRHAASR